MPRSQPTPWLLDHFSALKDPRQPWRVPYPLVETLRVVLCARRRRREREGPAPQARERGPGAAGAREGAAPSGMEDFVEIKLWGEHRIDFPRRFLAPHTDQDRRDHRAARGGGDLLALKPNRPPGHGPENMAVVKHMASNLVREPKDRHSLESRGKLANLNPDDLEKRLRKNDAPT